MMNPKLRWGVLGAGQIAKVFCNAMRVSQSSELVAVASRDRQRAKSLASFSGLSPRCEVSYESLLRSQDIDAVYIANLNHEHYTWALASLRAGKHTLVEKPITLHEDQLIELIELSKQNRLLLMEAFMYRCHPQLTLLESLLRQQTIGRVISLSARFGYQADFDPKSRLFDPALGGGVLFDIACYPTSMAIWLWRILGEEYPLVPSGSDVLEAKGSFASTEVDQEASLSYRLNNGVMVSLEASLLQAFSNEVQIEGTSGRIILKEPWLPSSTCRFADHMIPLHTHFTPSELLLEIKNREETAQVIHQVRVDRDLFTYEIDHFAESLTYCHSDKMPLTDSLANIKLLSMWREAISQ